MKKSSFVFSLAAAALSTSLWPGPALAQDTGHDHEHDKASAMSPETETCRDHTDRRKPDGNLGRHGGHEGDVRHAPEHDVRQVAGGSGAMIDKAMKGMSKEQKRQRMQMMDEKCK